MARVKGTVTYNGQPVAGATVSYMMEDVPRGASGVTDDDGNFKLTTYDTNDGAFIGTHKVTVTKGTAGVLGKEFEELLPEDLEKLTNDGRLDEVSGKKKGEIPLKYADVKTTPLQSTVEAGSNEKTIELED
jgi:hypothetical protein